LNFSIIRMCSFIAAEGVRLLFYVVKFYEPQYAHQISILSYEKYQQLSVVQWAAKLKFILMHLKWTNSNYCELCLVWKKSFNECSLYAQRSLNGAHQWNFLIIASSNITPLKLLWMPSNPKINGINCEK